MNTLTEPNTEPLSPGERLKNTRLKKKISLETVAQATHIRTDYLQALENNRWEEFPAEVYLVGFMKKYAQFLNLAPDGVAELYARGKASANRDAGNSPPATAAKPEVTEARTLPVRPSLVILAVATALAALLVFPRQHFMVRHQARPIVPAAPEHTLSVTALRDAWLNVSSANGRRLFRGTLAAASIQTFKSRTPFQLEVRKVADVRVEMDGTAVDLTGQEGRRIALPVKP